MGLCSEQRSANLKVLFGHFLFRNCREIEILLQELENSLPLSGIRSGKPEGTPVTCVASCIMWLIDFFFLINFLFILGHTS